MDSSELYDICIVGAGLVGSAAARHASSQSTYKVCLVGPLEPTAEERKTRSIFSCHYDEGRITRIFDPSKESQTLNLNSISRYHEIEALSGTRFYSPVGCLFYGEQDSDITDSAKNDNNSLATLINITSDFKSRFPFMELKKDEVAFLECSPAGQISPRKLVAAQQMIAKEQGCAIIHDIVENVNEEQMSDGSVAMKISTETGRTILSRKVLLCTNTFTNFKNLLPIGKKAKLEYERSQCSMLRISEKEAERLSNMPSIIYNRNTTDNEEGGFKVYGLPPILYPDGNYYIKIGWDVWTRNVPKLKSLEEIKEWYTGQGDPQKTEKLTEIMKNLLPGIKVESVKPLTCSTCHTPSNLPYIDLLTPQLGVAIGGNGTTAKSSDEVGRIASKLLMDGEWISELDREKFRFQSQN